jgi:hypothetical protein
MRLELGSRVECRDGAFGELTDVVVDPTARRITHLVVEPHRQRRLARLVPVELADAADDSARLVTLRATTDEVRLCPPVQQVSYLRLRRFPLDDPNWDVAATEVLALAYDPAREPQGFTVASDDGIPPNEMEIRRATAVRSADGHHLGHVDVFVVDGDDLITHLVLERGHLWARREVTVPIEAVARLDGEALTLTLKDDEVRALPELRVRHQPAPKRPDRRRSRHHRPVRRVEQPQ